MSATAREARASPCQFHDEGGNEMINVVNTSSPRTAASARRICSRRRPAILSNAQVRLIATATNDASATTAVVARMLAVILSVREILEWSTAAHVVDKVVMAARNPRIEISQAPVSFPAQSPLCGGPAPRNHQA
jgi:hypothetical protein